MSYTLAEAAAAVGMDKTTIRRAVRSGRISGTRDDLGVWHVEPAELHRVFPPVTAAAGHPGGDTTALPRDAAGDAVADALVAELRAQLARMDRTLDDTREDRDRWRAAFERQQALLPAPGRRWRWPWRRAG